MMYAVYRSWGDEVCHGRDILFVTASERVAEDAVALAELEQEAAFAIPYPSRDPTQNDSYSENLAEYKKKLAEILTIDPEGHDHGVDYHYEKVEVR